MPVTSSVHISLSVIGSSDLDTSNMSVSFARPIGFNYDAGDWVDLAVPGRELKGGKTYSLSSSPTEAELTIMFRRGLSTMKQYLQSLQSGDELFITQYGNDYDFHVRGNRSSVLIAGGIGIAPFRSMIKEMTDTDRRDRVQLLYFNKGSEFLLSDELDDWAKSLQVEIHYLNTETLKRKDRLKIFQTVMNHDAHHYFIAGPKIMVETTEHTLIDMGIDVAAIRIDSFGGY